MTYANVTENTLSLVCFIGFHLEENLYVTCMELHITVTSAFPDGPVVKTSPSNAGGGGLIPGWEIGILHALRPKIQETRL